VVRLSLKLIKAELEKKKTLDEKKGYLSEILKKIKGPKLKAKVEKLLEEAEKHIEHEERFDKDKLEHKISGAAAEPVEKSFSEVKYAQITQKGETAGLEREIKSAPTESKFASFSPPPYFKLADGSYMTLRDADRVAASLEETGLFRKVTADEFYSMDPTQKQMRLKLVSDAVGVPFERYEDLYSITKKMSIKSGDTKYQTKKW